MRATEVLSVDTGSLEVLLVESTPSILSLQELKSTRSDTILCFCRSKFDNGNHHGIQRTLKSINTKKNLLTSNTDMPYTVPGTGVVNLSSPLGDHRDSSPHSPEFEARLAKQTDDVVGGARREVDHFEVGELESKV